MKDYIKLAIFATLTVVLLCLVRSGHGLPGEYMDYIKRDPKPEIRSAKFDRKAIKDFMNNMARERSYYYDPEAVAKRQFGQMTNFNPGLGTLQAAIDHMLAEMDYNRRLNENKGRMAAGGRR